MALPPGMAEWFSRTFKSSGLPAYQMSGPGLQAARQQQQGRGYYGPAYASAEALGLPSSSGLRNYGPGYRESELAAGAAAEVFRPGAGFPGQQAAAERDYQQKKSQIAQLTAQDPDLKRYEEARKKAKTQQEMDEARDIGMAIWAARYGGPDGLASKVKPGQSGYEVIQNEINAGQMGPVTDLPFDSTKPFSTTPIPPEQRNVTYQGVSPLPIPGAEPVLPVAFRTPQTQMFETFRQTIAPGPSFVGSPLGQASIEAVPGYGAKLGNSLGTSISDESFQSEKAKQLAQMFINAQIGR